MRSVTRLAVFGLTAAALLSGGQSAQAQLTFTFSDTSTNLTGGTLPTSYVGDFFKVTISDVAAQGVAAKSFKIDFHVLAPDSGPTAGLKIGSFGLQLSSTAAAELVSPDTAPSGASGFSFIAGSGANASSATYASGNKLNGLSYNTIWDWPTSEDNALANNNGKSTSSYYINFNNTSVNLDNLFSNTGEGNNSVAVKIQGYPNNGSASLGGRLFAVPEPASMIAGLLGLPCIGGVVSLVRRRVSGAVVA